LIKRIGWADGRGLAEDELQTQLMSQASPTPARRTGAGGLRAALRPGVARCTPTESARTAPPSVGRCGRVKGALTPAWRPALTRTGTEHCDDKHSG
jgi:hypothetical protein